MRNLAMILADALMTWDQKHVSEPALESVRELARDGRFDEITILLQSLIEHFSREDLNFTIKHIPGVLLHQYVYGHTQASNAIVNEYWGDVGDAITGAVLKDGQLSVVMEKIMRDLQQLVDLLP